MSLIRPKNLYSMIDISKVEFAQVRKFNDDWVIEVYVKGRKIPHLLARSEDKSFVEAEFDKFVDSLAGVTLI